MAAFIVARFAAGVLHPTAAVIVAASVLCALRADMRRSAASVRAEDQARQDEEAAWKHDQRRHGGGGRDDRVGGRRHKLLGLERETTGEGVPSTPRVVSRTRLAHARLRCSRIQQSFVELS